MTSLSELKSIHEQRILDERAAFERERAAEIAAKHAAEQARIAAEQAKVQAERDEVLRIEQARADAEREARMRVEAAEAAERARLQIALEQQRHDAEISLRRAEVAKKRPKWMLGVTAMAVCAGIALTFFAVQRGREADEASERARIAQQQQQAALQEVKDSRAQLDRVQRDLDALDVRIQAAAKAVLEAQNDADRKHARELAMAAEQERIDAKRRLDEAKARHDAAIRHNGLDFTKCANSSALGCMDK